MRPPPPPCARDQCRSLDSRSDPCILWLPSVLEFVVENSERFLATKLCIRKAKDSSFGARRAEDIYTKRKTTYVVVVEKVLISASGDYMDHSATVEITVSKIMRGWRDNACGGKE